jgi:hypothetical protein
MRSISTSEKVRGNGHPALAQLTNFRSKCSDSTTALLERTRA